MMKSSTRTSLRRVTRSKLHTPSGWDAFPRGFTPLPLRRFDPFIPLSQERCYVRAQSSGCTGRNSPTVGLGSKTNHPIVSEKYIFFWASSFLFYIYLQDEQELEKVICQLNYEKSKLILGMGKQNSSYWNSSSYEPCRVHKLNYQPLFWEMSLHFGTERAAEIKLIEFVVLAVIDHSFLQNSVL